MKQTEECTYKEAKEPFYYTECGHTISKIAASDLNAGRCCFFCKKEIQHVKGVK